MGPRVDGQAPHDEDLDPEIFWNSIVWPGTENENEKGHGGSSGSGLNHVEVHSSEDDCMYTAGLPGSGHDDGASAVMRQQIKAELLYPGSSDSEAGDMHPQSFAANCLDEQSGMAGSYFRVYDVSLCVKGSKMCGQLITIIAPV